MHDRLSAAEHVLYGAKPADFVATRTRLEREARDAGDEDQAAAIKRLPKPTLAAWTLNTLSRQHRRDIDLLLDAGHRLRRTQAALSSKDRAEFTQARQLERDAIRKLTAAARTLLEGEAGKASAAVLLQVAETLRAAAGSEEARELLARGVLVKPLRPDSGFGLEAGTGPRDEESRQDPGDDAQRREQVRERRKVLKDAEAACRAAARELERRDRGAATAEQDARALHAKLEQAEKRLTDARQAAADAARTLAHAEEALATARDAVDR